MPDLGHGCRLHVVVVLTPTARYARLRKTPTHPCYYLRYHVAIAGEGDLAMSP